MYAAAAHGLLSGSASEAIQNSPIKKVFVTDTVETGRDLGEKVEVVSVGGLFGEAIERIETGESLSELFETD